MRSSLCRLSLVLGMGALTALAQEEKPRRAEFFATAVRSSCRSQAIGTPISPRPRFNVPCGRARDRGFEAGRGGITGQVGSRLRNSLALAYTQ